MDKNVISQKPAISIIIPVYNVENYLVRCLDSIFSQHFSWLLEVIAVEDASTDNSLNILKEYQKTENRLKVIEHGVNKKLSIARATGMKCSTGDYIMHVDSDDWLLDNSLENLYKKCLETDADILVFNYSREDNDRRAFLNPIKKELITTDKIQVQPYFLGTSWNKIIKRALSENLISGEVGVNTTEDLLYATEILLKAEKICLIPHSYYVYFANTESLTWVIKPTQLLERLVIILHQVKKITFKYNATSQFIDNILIYLERNIYLAIAQSAFLFKVEKIQNVRLINAFRLFTEMTDKRLKRLSLCMRSKYYSLIVVFFQSGILPVFIIILKALKIQSLINKS